MPYKTVISYLSSAIALSLASSPLAAEDTPEQLKLSPLVVTAVPMDTPYTVTADTRAVQAGIPAQDGGSYLKNIPGFSVSRKGGTSGDPELRGLGGSRLAILANDSLILGGCGGRMDPPTAYIYPQNYDRIEVIKGPQSVRYGAAPAGVVHFDRDKPNLTEAVTEGFASFTTGSHSRNDLMSELMVGDEMGYLRLMGTLSKQDNYRDGDGTEIHSQYHRWSTSTLLGWTPTKDSRIEFSYERSDGEAAYDDRGMDGTEFARTAYTLAASQTDVTSWLASIEAKIYYNYVDHVMDNFRLRQPPGMAMASNPDRLTRGGRLSADLILSEQSLLVTGLDYTDNKHRFRGTTDWRNQPRVDRAEFSDLGVFAELDYEFSRQTWLAAGIRVDRASAEALNPAGFGGVAQGERDTQTLWSGFSRMEHTLSSRPVNLYAGLGHASRAPDFWERMRFFHVNPEKLTQLDAGLSFSNARWEGTISIFYGKIKDYVLISAPGVEARQARNIDATTYGAESDLTWSASDVWSFTATLATVRSTNDTDNKPLAQTPPLEGSISMDYAKDKLYFGSRLRAVMAQHRLDAGYGTIYSLDTEKSAGFATLGIYAGVDLFANARLTLGIDNAFDRTFAEHIQRGSADLGSQALKINEPGRLLWANLKVTL